ncbi:dephospho-CoA kinase [Pedobacter sp. MC2016-15]|uniref:dephospho-CoA kinase n=1 Tax=Pedobacter sp. MC2016-15 TaxID=2994473 RepID=UPI0022457084|nr:dephospho-CoA kinase [Pedobacter sp. MC2016-15]MCX2480126.1 dephospho-CoA kinase [Pedobacter sp. MC2016-15]
MIKVGITGGIGSGKSMVCRIFASLGVPVFYADTVSKEIMVTDAVLIEGVKAAFGEESYDAAGKLNNKHIASIVFNHTEELARLNALVHPAVFRAFDSWLGSIPADTPYILKETAILFESGSYKLSDLNVVVTAPVTHRLKWVMDRDGATEEQVMARMNKQLTDQEKLKMADFMIRNDESQSLILQVLELHNRFIKITE